MKHKVALFAFMRKMLVKMSAVARLVTPVLIIDESEAFRCPLDLCQTYKSVQIDRYDDDDDDK